MLTSALSAVCTAPADALYASGVVVCPLKLSVKNPLTPETRISWTSERRMLERPFKAAETTALESVVFSGPVVWPPNVSV